LGARGWIDAAIGLLYPPTCVLCGADGRAGLDLCSGCLADMPHNRHCCPRCALPLPPDQAEDNLCGTCQRRPPPFAYCHAALRYEDPVPMLVGAAKFRGRLNVARLLGECLLVSLRKGDFPMPELLIPVPLHRSRLRERGYNQALEVARPAARALGLQIETGCCIRAQPTAPQAELDREARRRNVRGAFRVLQAPPARHVALIDDVMTTGSTVSELTKALLRAGVERVDVWAVARTD
jgi:ComF family protein